MPTVIINEFELVPAPPADTGPTATPTALDNPATVPAPSESKVLELEYLLQRQTERLLRVWAH